MIVEYFDSKAASAHDSFQQWRTDNQDGVFLTLNTKTRGTLHGAQCRHLGSGPPYFLLEAGWGSLTTKRKVCGSEVELTTWANDNGVEVKHCKHCVHDELISDVQPASLNPRAITFTEGSIHRTVVDRYERDPKARNACIQHYGTKCVLCGFDFVTVYGDVMTAYIQVHHLNPLSEIGAEYVVDPVADLRPVCANCHAVIHRRSPPFSMNEMKALLDRHAKPQARAGSK